MALRFVNKQNPALCLEAVKQNGRALYYVQDQTEKICVEAVKQNLYALKFVQPAYFKNATKTLRMRALFDAKTQLYIDNLARQKRGLVNGFLNIK